jgi:capsular polysaccharide biosynthesis protein
MRQLLNEEELEDALSRYWGARIVRMGDLSVADQVAVTRTADVIVGPHGAAMTNMLFAPNGRSVVELLVDRYPRSFVPIAEIAGHDYFPVFGVAEGDKVGHESDLRWRIDVDRVLRVLDRVVARPRHHPHPGRVAP